MAFNMGRPIASLPVPSVSGKDEIMKAAREANMLDAARKQREDKESKILAREMAEKNADVERRRIHATLLEAEFEKLKPPSPPPPTPPPHHRHPVEPHRTHLTSQPGPSPGPTSSALQRCC